MTKLSVVLQRYIETLTGKELDLRPTNCSKLPLFLSERYECFSTRLFETEFLFALESSEWEAGSPQEYAKAVEMITASFAQPTVIVLRRLQSYARNRLVQMGVPFIVPGTQAFLPNHVVDLRDHFPRPTAQRRDRFSPAAQFTLLYHLLREPLAGISLKEIAEKVHYSRIMITNVKDELEAAGFCEVVREGRSLVLHFQRDRKAFWQMVEPQLASPIKRTRLGRWATTDIPAPEAGLSALSRQTNLADDRLPTYAVSLKQFEYHLESGTLIECEGTAEANAKIEVWSYDPIPLGSEMSVDPLSLYLTLRKSRDERIEQQLELLLSNVSW